MSPDLVAAARVAGPAGVRTSPSRPRLAGIVAGAGIRFRTNIREVVDTLFFLIAICIGVASGVGSLGIALVTSIVFTYALLITTTLDFGGLNRASTKESKKPEDRDEPEPVE